ncbi:hypothetical protein OH76DRAFT_504104 [Lentinus brumalis]|uniref:Uncharacterized protein n=1 Tax=Lentinus brumalis TaxID=2498619 RepID=A0A371DBT7_9APHY|nr:hypothetical protein OH76DRAFT_504104 [Polyporus brumalis]
MSPYALLLSPPGVACSGVSPIYSSCLTLHPTLPLLPTLCSSASLLRHRHPTHHLSIPAPMARGACKNPFADQATLSMALLVWISAILMRVFGCVIEASGISDCPIGVGFLVTDIIDNDKANGPSQSLFCPLPNGAIIRSGTLD